MGIDLGPTFVTMVGHNVKILSNGPENHMTIYTVLNNTDISNS